ASLINSLLTRRSGLARHAPRCRASTGGRVRRRCWMAWRVMTDCAHARAKSRFRPFVIHSHGVTMSDKNKTQYTSRLSLHITPAMGDRLDQIALMRDEAKAEIVRAALRAYLDEQEDLLSSRKHFTKMFQRRVDYMERLLVICLWLNVQAMQILYERVKKEPYDLADLLKDAIGAGIATEDGVHGLVERAVQGKTKPPAK